MTPDRPAVTRARLSAVWELAKAIPNEIETPEHLATAPLQWRPTNVPGTVAATLQSDHEWRWDSQTNLDTSDWWYRGTFTRAEITSALGLTESETNNENERITLVFEGLATIADVWLNGTHLLHSSNMYRASRADVTKLLQDTNTIHLRFSSLTAELAKRRPRPAWRTKLVDQQQLRWIRTTLLGRMPGWSSGPQAVGPWGEIAIERHTDITIVEQDIRTRVDGDHGIVEVAFRIQGHISAAHLTVGTHSYPLECKTGEGAYRSSDVTRNTEPRSGPGSKPDGAVHETVVVRGTVAIPNVELWWPHTHGTQPRYPTQITLSTTTDSRLIIDCGALAFRVIELDTTDGNFAFRINGVPIFSRGACWSTVDAVRLHGTRAQYRDALELARHAGMNMLRVGGTMVYEHDDFYDLCDELGILVWQDFMFANMDYPFTDSTFAGEVHDETVQLIRRTQRYACLAVWCGNSEIEQQTAMLGLPESQWSSPFFRETLPAVCGSLRPDVPYWPSSPSGGTLPFQVNAGDAHYFGYGPYLREFSDVQTSGVRFASETLACAHVPEPETVDQIPGGANGAGHHPGWKAGVARDNGSSWDFEDVRDHYVGTLFAVNPMPLRYGDPDRYLALSRVASGELIHRAVGFWRRPSSRCNGALLWFYRDLRPGAGWGVIDSFGRPKAAYYAARRAFLPIAVFLQDEGLNGIVATLVNDTPSPVDAVLTVNLYCHGELHKGDATDMVHVPSHGATEIHIDAMFEGFRDLSYAYRFGPPNHDLVVVTLTDRTSGSLLADAYFFPTDLALARELDLGLVAEARALPDGSYELTVRTRKFAQFVTIDVGHFRPLDNYFHVAPESKRTVILSPFSAPAGSGVQASGRERQPTGTVTALNSHGSSRIVLI